MWNEQIHSFKVLYPPGQVRPIAGVFYKQKKDTNKFRTIYVLYALFFSC